MTSATATRVGGTLIAALAFVTAWLALRPEPHRPTDLLREESVALWIEGRFDEAEALQREVIARDDATPQDVANLACTYLRRAIADRSEERFGHWCAVARDFAEQARARDPDLPAANWILGAYAAEFSGKYDHAAAYDHFARVVRARPDDLTARLHLAEQCEKLGRDEEALEHGQRIVDAGLEYAGIAVYRTGLYHYFRTLQARNRGDDRERAVRYARQHGKLPENTPQEEIDRWVGQLGVPQGVARWVAGATLAGSPGIEFGGAEAALRQLAEAGAAASIDAGDFDGDGRDDLVVAGERGLFVGLARRDGSWRVVQVSATSFRRVVAAELENEGGIEFGVSRASLLALDERGLHLLHPRDDESWIDDTAKLPPLAAVTDVTPVDFDHDGHLDLVCATGEGLRLVRSLGVPRTPNGVRMDHDERHGEISFVDVTADAGLTGVAARWAAIEDFDGDHDVDLLVGGADAPTLVLSNLRRTKFQRISATSSGLPDRLELAPVVGDADGDGVADVVLPAGTTAALCAGRGDGTFGEARPLPIEASSRMRGELIDLDLDGSLDLVVVAGGRARWLRREADGWAAAAELPGRHLEGASALVLDVDRDLVPDVVAIGASGVEVHRGLLRDPPLRALLTLRGRKDNHGAVGTVVEVRAGNRYQRRFTTRPTQLLGFVHGATPIVRLTWPNGVLQYPLQIGDTPDVDLHAARDDAPIRLPADLSRDVRGVVEQKKGPPGSCPFLYSWDGTKYVFVTDVLGTTPLGLPLDESSFVVPDHDELVRVTSAQLAPRDGEYRLQLTEELRETTYLDRAQLWVVDHAADVEVHPEERFCFPPFPEQRVHALRAIRPLARAIDQAGRDWSDELARADDVPAVPFTPLPETYRGIASLHVLELALPDEARTAPRVRLLMTGWLQWGDASVNLAAAHNGTVTSLPPVVSAPDTAAGGDPAAATWRDCGPPVGFVAGKTKSMVLDVTAMVNRADPRLRFTSTLELYWDQVRVALDGDDAPFTVTKLEPKLAELRYRGFSKPLPGRRPEQPQRFDWDRLEEQARWNQHPGLLTRYGDVLPLLGAIDDRFVILSSGDAIDLRFDASSIAPIAPGMARTFLVYLDGWAKDADPNTTYSQSVEPLPFHGMSGYPYGPDEHYPTDAAHEEYRREWNTRPGRRLIPDLAAREDSRLR